MNILIFNWRDIKNPLSGGAEILTHEMAVRWVKQGHTVTIFSSYFLGGKKEEIIDGIQIIRKGRPDIRTLLHSVHFQAFLYYRKISHKKIDILIDEIHGMPFFTPLYSQTTVVPLICEVAKDIWDKMFPFPWNIIGKYIEKLSLQLYRKKIFLTISESTRSELISYGIKKQNIQILPMGINRVPMKEFKKEEKKTIIFVGRLSKMKGIEDVIESTLLIKKEFKDVQVWIIGKGESKYTIYLKNMVKKNLLDKNIKFFGFVSQRKKFELMARAHLIVVPSTREGFGLIVPEAGTVGTPAVVYNVPGLRDVVENDITGKRVEKNYTELAKGVLELLMDDRKRTKMSIAAKRKSKSFNWDNTASDALKLFKKHAKK